MHLLHVTIHVKPEHLEAFKTATLANARASLAEPGIARFDVVQQQDDPTRFMLLEAYRTPADHAAHRETPHYAAWRDTVAPMMAEPRTAQKYTNLFPSDPGW
jgi:quinol monooxygenase YgiN